MYEMCQRLEAKTLELVEKDGILYGYIKNQREYLALAPSLVMCSRSIDVASSWMCQLLPYENIRVEVSTRTLSFKQKKV